MILTNPTLVNSCIYNGKTTSIKMTLRAAVLNETDLPVPRLSQDALDSFHFTMSGLHFLRAEGLLWIHVHIALRDGHLLWLCQLYRH